MILPDDDQMQPPTSPTGLVTASRAARREAARQRARARRRRWRSLILVLVLVGAAVVVVRNVAGLPIPGLDEQITPGVPVRVQIPEGASTRQISRILAEADVVARASAFERAAVERGVADQLKPGDYLLETGMDENELFDILVTGPSATADRITFPEGLTVRQIVERMTAGGRWTREEVEAALEDPSLTSPYRPRGKPLEGLLFPATYDLQPGGTPVDLLRAMLDELEQVMSGMDLAAAGRLGLTEYEILIVASMIEREARVPQDRAKVARVIYNRLARDMALQIDATIQYTFDKPKPRLSTRDLEVDSPYNTYKRKGLPPTPIAAPGAASIEAALAPADGPWLYYVVTSKDGAHTFTDSYDEFLRLKAKAQRDGVA